MMSKKLPLWLRFGLVVGIVVWLRDPIQDVLTTNVEVWHYDSPAGTGVSPNPSNRVPDVINYAWREYGMRVGLWRIADVLDAAGVKATVALNSAVCETFPKAMDEMKKRGWEFMGHGTTNSESLGGLNPEKEREVIQHVLKTIEQSTGPVWSGAARRCAMRSSSSTTSRSGTPAMTPRSCGCPPDVG